MPINGPASYISTTEEFLAHWESVNSWLGVGHEIVLYLGITRADLQARLNELIGSRDVVLSALKQEELARATVEDLRRRLLERINQFCQKIRALFSDTKWERALPKVPGILQGEAKFIDALEDAANIWLRRNAEPAPRVPITLFDGYTQSQFQDDINALRAAYTAVNVARSNANLAREARNDVQDAIYPILKNYRQAVPTFFEKTHAMVETLPRLTPLPGSTPEAVTATAEWYAGRKMARITWEASSDPDLEKYQIRFSPGAHYSTDGEAVIGNVAPGEPLEFFTNEGLASPGDTASFKVYVITKTGNEKGSKAVQVTWPE